MSTMQLNLTDETHTIVAAHKSTDLLIGRFPDLNHATLSAAFGHQVGLKLELEEISEAKSRLPSLVLIPVCISQIFSLPESDTTFRPM